MSVRREQLPSAATDPREDEAMGEPEQDAPAALRDVAKAAPAEAPVSAPRQRAMAAVRWLLLAAVTVLAAYTVWTYWGPPSHVRRDARVDRYYCPMHPQIRSPDPGECPICHMNLEPIPAERQQAAPEPTTASNTDASAPSAPGEDAGVLTALVPVTLALDRQQAIGVSTAPVTVMHSAGSLRAPGVVEVPENATAQVHVRAAGYLERTAVRQTGVRVARGQVLAWFFSPQIYQAQLELLRANGWAAEGADHDAARGRLPDRIGAPAVEIVQAGRHGLELLGVDAADIDAIVRSGEPMRAVPIRAPAPGYVMRFAAVPGSYVAPEMTLYEIADLSRVWVVASLYERDLPRVQQGMSARFSVPGDSTPSLGRVALIEPDISVATRTARVRVDVANPATALRPGQYGDVLFNLPASQALGVPRDAVIDTGVDRYVFVDLGGGRFAPRPVRVGALVGGHFEVTSGLRAGERVVVRGNFMLDSESRLQASLSAVPATDAGSSADAGTGARSP